MHAKNLGPTLSNMERVTKLSGAAWQSLASGTYILLKLLDLINFTSNKAGSIPDELKSCALETIEQRYLVNKWLHIKLTGHTYQTNGAGSGWLCRPLEDSLPVEINATNYNGEVSAVRETTTQLLAAGPNSCKSCHLHRLPSCNFSLKQ
ncbi:reverse transcriptase [Trichonephila clavipes]|nr:reverse transcriptase [Trichonephila clavipes]